MPYSNERQRIVHGNRETRNGSNRTRSNVTSMMMMAEAEAPAEGEAVPTEEGDGEGTELTTTEGDESDSEPAGANGQRTLTLEDMKLWSSIDLDKNGKLTIAEFDRSGPIVC